MHGFLGYVEPREGARAPMLAWMREWAGAGVPRQFRRIDDGPFGYVATVQSPSDAEPIVTGEDGLAVGFNGFIAADQLAGAGRPEPTDGGQVARALLARYRAGGPDALAALNGRYLGFVWDAPERALHLVNDALGLMPVFLWHRGESSAFASNVWAIACHPDFRKEVNPRGVLDLLLLSHQQDDRTLFRDVTMLPPGSVTTVQDGEVTSRTVRNLEFSEERWEWSIERAAEEMYELLAQSVRRRVPEGERVTLPLSGGFDSRVLLGLLREQGAEIGCVTQHQSGLYAEDTRYARRLARVAGVPHRVVHYRDEFLASSRERAVAISGGMYDIHTGRHLSWFDPAVDAELPVVSAHLGGELTSRFQIPDTRFSTAEEQFRIAFNGVNEFRFAPDELREMVAGRVPADLVDEAVEENRRFFMSQDGAFFHRFYHWDLLLSRRRYISFQLFYFDQLTRIVAPFYDLDFIDFVCSLPFAAICRQHAYRLMIAEHFPDLAKIPNTNDVPVLTSTKEVLRDFMATRYRRFVQRPLRLLLPLRRWIGHPMKQYGYALRGAARPVLDHIEANLERIAPYFDPGGVRGALEAQLAGDDAAPMGILGLSAFVTALDMLEDPYAAIRAWAEAPTDKRKGVAGGASEGEGRDG